MAGRSTPAEGRYGGKDAAQRQAERRARFLEAGLELFGGELGYRGTRLAALCKEAGLSSRQFYEEFHSLEDLLAELHLMVNDVAQQAVNEILPEVRDLPLAERIPRLLHAYVKGAAADRRHARIAYVEIIGVSPRMDLQRLERRAGWIDFLRTMGDDAVQRGELPPGDHRIAAAAFIGAVNGLMHDWVIGWVDASLEEIADELLQFLLGRYRITS
ncbi:TetR/AcrR family transcriptional regulator [Amycolatopsis magusensis]|uniref:AcrR family transcriptional regulator n=1 Tax=Amycolatopsis magusensis TaxID=882444 RepID=A0ABS4PX55_9PSEU|nr:TetR/AcrR family transcriptional regulator [Amycolatopsis magusensis]MBP2184007.1 AcrR family transcriptional regulator [Amycolatopsis magusensis]MDI5979998.1 TetR/AcrR family transcriptional regulator [Amycolatopsis magusensis]